VYPRIEVIENSIFGLIAACKLLKMCSNIHIYIYKTLAKIIKQGIFIWNCINAVELRSCVPN